MYQARQNAAGQCMGVSLLALAVTAGSGCARVSEGGLEGMPPRDLASASDAAPRPADLALAADQAAPLPVDLALPVADLTPLPWPATSADNGGSIFSVVSRNSNSCLAVSGNATSDGAAIVQMTCDNSAPQSWRLQTTNDGYFYFVDVTSQKVLEVGGASLADGAAADQATNVGGTQQQFQLVATTDGWFEIVARHSSKPLEVAGCSTADGVAVDQRAADGQPCQEWRLQPIGPVLIVNKNSGKVLEVAGGAGATGDGPLVDLRVYGDSGNQHWTWQHVSDGYYEVVAQHSGKVIDAENCSSTPGSTVRQWTWLDNVCQQWRLVPSSDGYFRISNRESSLVIDVLSCGTADGTTVQQFTDLDNDCQHYRFASPGFDASPSDVGAHDPQIIAEGAQFYLATTGGTLALRQSTDLVHWSAAGSVFATIPSWVDNAIGSTITDLWAPNIVYWGGQYRLYYAASVFGTTNSVIGLATSPTLDNSSASYHWSDAGLVLQTSANSGYNAIDPNVVVDDQGVPWLVFGSWGSGIKLRRLDPTSGLPATADPTLYTLAARDSVGIEAPSILFANGYYYLFVSFDNCCDGADSTYRTMVGRATAITGPYTDRSGNAMTAGNAEQLLTSIDHWRGPGGGTAFFAGSQAYYVSHYYDALDNGTPKLQIRRISWSVDNWPVLSAPVP